MKSIGVAVGGGKAFSVSGWWLLLGGILILLGMKYVKERVVNVDSANF